jgi:hypothetical protein
MIELPWDDEDRLPALLDHIEAQARDLRVMLERETRLWRAHQPGYRRAYDLGLDPEDDPSNKHALVRGSLRRVTRDLGRVAEDIEELREDLDRLHAADQEGNGSDPDA